MSTTLRIQDGDLVLLPQGVFDTVTDEAKLRQDIAETTLNNLDPQNPSWFTGSLLYTVEANPQNIIKSGIGVEQYIQVIIDEALQRLIDLQEEDEYITDKERISEVEQIIVQKIGNSAYIFYAIVRNDSDEQVAEDIVLRVPGSLPPGMAENLSNAFISRQDVSKTFL